MLPGTRVARRGGGATKTPAFVVAPLVSAPSGVDLVNDGTFFATIVAQVDSTGSSFSRMVTKMNMEQQKARSKAQEMRLAAVLGGRRVPGSGSLGAPGDVRTAKFLLQCKVTGQKTLRIDVADVEKIAREAAYEAKCPMMAFQLDAIGDRFDRDWVMLPMRALLGWLRDGRVPRRLYAEQTHVQVDETQPLSSTARADRAGAAARWFTSGDDRDRHRSDDHRRDSDPR